MNRKSQITIFIIVGIIILIVFAGFFSLKKNIENKKIETEVEKISSTFDTYSVKYYIEKCMKNLGMAVVELIGNQGGYIDPDCSELEIYKLCFPVNYTTYSDFNVTIYLNGSKNYLRPNITQMEEQISRYVILGMDGCVEDFKTAIKIAYTIRKPGIGFPSIDFNYTRAKVDYSDILAKSEATITKEDITIRVDYPLLFETDNFKTVVYDFRATLPVRLKLVHNISEILAGNMTRIYPEEYNLTLDCEYIDSIAINRTTIEIVEDNHLTSVILISDWGYYNKSASNEAFQFYFAANSTNITGEVTYDACPQE